MFCGLCSIVTQHGCLLVCVCVFFRRERERELYGPKKRGPKPKTFLLKVTLSFMIFYLFVFTCCFIYCHNLMASSCCSVRFFAIRAISSFPKILSRWFGFVVLFLLVWYWENGRCNRNEINFVHPYVSIFVCFLVFRSVFLFLVAAC